MLLSNSKYVVVILVFCIAGLLEGCSHVVTCTFDDLSMLKMGLDTTSVNKLFGDPELSNKQTVQLAGTDYTVKYLWILTGIEPTGHYTRTASGQIINDYQPSYNPFRLIFKQGKLMFWGFDYEFSMSEDPELQNLYPLLVDIKSNIDMEK